MAKYSLAISEKLERLGVRCKKAELVRGALLHDYFLYDWHNSGREGRLHGFYHPGIALRNAMKEYKLTPREKDIIKKHMWPLTIVPPMCREAWIVTTADKWCSLLNGFPSSGRLSPVLAGMPHDMPIYGSPAPSKAGDGGGGRDNGCRGGAAFWQFFKKLEPYAWQA